MTTTTRSPYLAARAVATEVSTRTRLLARAAGLSDLIALGRGDPDFDSPPAAVEGAIAALRTGTAHHYTVPAGLAELRRAIAARLQADKGLDYAPEQIIVCNGCQEALLVAILALVDPGDEVVLQAPRFNAFDYMVNLAGGRVIDVATRQEDDFALRADRIRAVLTDRTKVLVVANPNNPTGALIDQEELARIAELAAAHDLVVISDEIYDRIVFDGREHVSLATLGDLYERTITVNGFSKTYAMTGWRVGYLAAPHWFMDPAIEIKHSISICTAPIMQAGALAALERAGADRDAMVRTYQRRRDVILDGLSRLGLSAGYPGGGLYVYTNVSGSGLGAERFSIELLEQQHVLVFPATMFADPADTHVRLTLLSDETLIAEALARIGRFLGRG